MHTAAAPLPELDRLRAEATAPPLRHRDLRTLPDSGTETFLERLVVQSAPGVFLVQGGGLSR